MEYEFKKITLEQMIEYIETNAPKDKKWFKSVALDEKDRYNHIKARKAFCEKYMPEIIPTKKEKMPNKSDILKKW